MPITLPPLSRRRFLAQTLPAGAALLATARGAQAADPTRESWILFSDTHIDANPATEARGAVMAANLEKVVAEVLADPTPAAAVMLNGDCAYLKGLAGDYRTLAPRLDPLRQAGLPLHLAMGNHDDRRPFFEVFQSHRPEAPPVPDKHVGLIPGRSVNWFLLDSLLQVNQVTGELGRPQLDWLGRLLARHADKPAVVIGHHNPQWEPAKDAKGNPRHTGIRDTGELFTLLDAHSHVQAYVFGHTHNWSLSRSPNGIPLVNLPPVAYVFNPARPNGWVRATAGSEGLTFQLHALNKKHDQHDQKFELPWRKA